MGRIEPHILKGFRDYLPEVMVPRVKLLRAIASVFERFGFEPLDTPSLEYAEILLGKLGPEAEKLFYRFKDAGERDIALRYEFTISLARVMAQYRDLPRPFRRYQMGPVWRAESPARGRFREFWQCDVDIVGTHSLLADAECIAVDHAVMQAVGAPEYRIRFNNRKLFAGLQERLGIAEGSTMAAAVRSIDKQDKIGREGVRAELEDLVAQGKLTTAQVNGILNTIVVTPEIAFGGDPVVHLRERLADSPTAQLALDEIEEVRLNAFRLGVPESGVLYFDPSIARGLDYYTGTVFETTLDDLPRFGSVMSGGRYDGLIGLFAGEDIPAVGISVGVDRLIAALEELQRLPAARASAQALVTVFDNAGADYAVRVATMLRDGGVNTELWLEPGAKLQKQMKYADRKGIPCVVVTGPDEQAAGEAALKVMATGAQQRVKLDALADAIRAATPQASAP